jgi:hypothetical protein
VTGTAFVQPQQGEDLYQSLMGLVGAANGYTDWQRLWNITGVTDNSSYLMTLRNRGTGGALNVLNNSGASLMVVNNSGVSVGVLAAVTVAASSTVTASRFISTVATGTSPVTVTSTTLNTNLNADMVDGLHAASFALASALSGYVAKTGDTMTGVLTIEPSTPSDQSLKLKYSNTVGAFWLGGSNAANPVLVFKDNGNTQTFEVGNSASTYQAKVLGAGNVTGSLTVGGGISAGASSAITGGLTVVTGGLTVSAGSSSFAADLTMTDGTFIHQNSGNKRFEAGSTGVGFFGSAQQAKQSLVGVKTGTLAQLQTAFGNLASLLANYGLLADLTT